MTVTRPAPQRAPASSNGSAKPKTFNRTRGLIASTNCVVIYGPGGVGKSTLASMAPSPLVLDLERSTSKIDVERIDNIESWAELRACLRSDIFSGIKTLIIDSATAAEEMCRKHVIDNVTTDKGQRVTSLEGYGWGKGYVHLFEEWRQLLGDLDRHRRERNIVIICHERIGKVPNPSGDDYIRYEPRLYHGSQASILLPTKEWSDEVWFVGYDVEASDGKAKGSGTRTIYVTETATHMAKTRSLEATPMEFQRGSDAIWNKLLNKPVADDVPPAE